jgi:hypothetical protein
VLHFLEEPLLDPKICGVRRGKPFIIQHPKSPAAKASMNIVDNIERFLNGKAKL